MTISIYLPESLLDEIKKRATEDCRSVSSMIRVLLMKALTQ